METHRYCFKIEILRISSLKSNVNLPTPEARHDSTNVLYGSKIKSFKCLGLKPISFFTVVQYNLSHNTL
jgi:hypothetical protein